MSRYKAIIAYDGTGYSGWQFQTNAVGVQQIVEETLAGIEGAPVRVFGSSRTDAGVHAEGFCAHFDLASPIPPENLVRAVNARLPDAVRFVKASFAPAGFDARLSAKGKEYQYRVFRADVMPPHLARYWTHVRRPLDVPAMADAARRFVGRHDFVSFSANPDRELESTVREVFSFDVKASGPRIMMKVRGDGFLYKQVRSMAGFVLAVGLGREKPEAVDEILAAAAPRTARVETAPARGLFLVKVFYSKPHNHLTA